MFWESSGAFFLGFGSLVGSLHVVGWWRSGRRRCKCRFALSLYVGRHAYVESGR
jgi:hypothetical protein